MMSRYPIQTSDVLPELLDDWDIPPQGQVSASENVQIVCGDYDGDGAKSVSDGFAWVHIAGTRDRISVQKGFQTLEAAETAAKERARLTGASFIPSNTGGEG